MTEKITRLAELVRMAGAPPHVSAPDAGRNAWTRAVDALLLGIRRYLPWLHAAGAWLSGGSMFLYAWIVARSARLLSAGETKWPDLPGPCVLTLWHGSAPSLLCAIAARRPRVPMAIMVATEPRGDSLKILCGLLGMRVIRGDWVHHGWPAVARLAQAAQEGACVILTPDGGAPRRVARAGALVLAASADVPVVALGAACRPSIREPHKWDRPENPLPFSRLAIAIGEPVHFAEFTDVAEIEPARLRLQAALDAAHRQARAMLGLTPEE